MSREIHLAAHFPGVNNTTVWSDPEAGSHIDFQSFVHLAQTAERGLFDFFFLAEGLRMREHGGALHELDVAGRPEGNAVLAALAGVTERLGLMNTITTTYHEPYELARQLASLDHLSDGRAGWNLVTSSDAFTGANFRRGGYLPYDARYERGEQFVAACNAMWDSGTSRPVRLDGTQVALDLDYSVPVSPQGRPVMLQAGDSPAGREFAAQHADGIFTRHGTLQDGKAFFADVKRRLEAYGRTPDDLKIMPGATFLVGDTDDDARELHREVRRAQVSGPHAIMFLEQVWRRDLSQYDPEGPLPSVDPADEERTEGSAMARTAHREALETAKRWRERAEADDLSIRELVIAMTERQAFVGSPQTVAETMATYVDAEACDGFILIPHVTPGGLDRFVDEVVPLLQERGSFRTEYEGTTLRENLGVSPAPVGAATA